MVRGARRRGRAAALAGLAIATAPIDHERARTHLIGSARLFAGIEDVFECRAERAEHDRLRRCPNHRVRLHRGRDHPRARGRQPAPGLSRRGRPAVSLAALKDWTFLFGPGLIVPFGNGLILGYLMYKSGLVPRRVAWLGLIGGPLLLIGNTGVLFDRWEPTTVAFLVALEFCAGAVPRDLRGGLGIPEGCSDPLGAQYDRSADRDSVGEGFSLGFADVLGSVS